ncbi:hypothetical protein MAR_033368 [Mya arenaria]|uniref:KY-like immunoglobulin-like domain-containing protein n=1 Tax=Mya arenaria TaxID=6604 RepID=A0ABY7GCZ0_MYAAR|nr:hypothetical protein MAR_033368 [Mya arenaria]
MGCSSSSPDTNNNQPVAKKSPKAKSSGSNVGAENETNRKRENNHPELKQEPEIEDVDVPKTEHGYPVAKEPPDRKADIFNPQKLKGVEARARAAPDNLADSYEELIAYLTSECKNDVEKVRALFIWMANQEIDDGNYSNVTGSDTPRGIMKLMKDNRASYSSFFALLCRTGSRWDFGIRFPETGVYKLQIVGGKGYEGDMCAFKIRADEVKDDVKPLPFNPGKVGYGPTMDTELAGIKAISHKSGLVKMNIKKHMEFNFKLTKDIVVRTELLHSTISKEELQQYCVTTQRNRNVHVAVNVPEEGEYALALHAQQKNHSDYDNVCNYLLTSETGKKKRQRKWETPQEKKTRRNVTDLSKTRGTKNLSELESEIERFHKLDMEDKGELAKAEDALEYKKDRKELEDAMNRRHLETLEKAIARGEKSRFRDKLTKQLDEAKDIREHLLHLNKIAHDILEMKQPTISELRRLGGSSSIDGQTW